MPSLIVAGSVALAVGLIHADSTVGNETLASWPRLFGAGADTVVIRMLDALQTIATLTAAVPRRKALREQAQWIEELAHRGVESPHDLAAIDARLENLCVALEEKPPALVRK